MESARSRKPDYATFAGLALAAAGILGGLVLENGQIRDVAQLTAFLIVFGGTTGAVLVSTPAATLVRALKHSSVIFFEEPRNDGSLVARILHFAMLARRGGITSIEGQALNVEHPLLRKGLLLAVDGVDTMEIRRQMELELRVAEDRAEEDARVFEAAGGYAPTIGIIGAVLGLIQVMKHLDAVSEIGKGIAVAFVATVYGVASANLVLLPAAAKLRFRARNELQTQELIVEGVLAIAEGLNSHLIRMRLESFLEEKALAPVALPSVGKPQTVAGRTGR
ncbi:MAG: flagellar motor protein [Candidatus Solibacter sp.]